jgi:uncharacterized protein
MPEFPVKRFIAGAVCPRCGCMDTLRMFRDGDAQVRECVRCNYADKLDAAGNVLELPTRVNQPRPGEQPLRHEEEIQVLKLEEGELPRGRSG